MRTLALAALAVVGLVTSSASAANWSAFNIREVVGATTALNPVGAPDGSSFSVVIDEGGEKAGYGTDFYNGLSVSSLGVVSYNRVDQGSGEIYSNLWVTDGAGKYALLTPRNVSAIDGYTSSTINGVDLKTLGVGVYGTNIADVSWMLPGATVSPNRNLFLGGAPVTLADLGHLTVASPTFPGYGLAGGGDPKAGFGFQLVFGDTQNNHLNGRVAYEISDVTATAVPLPASALGGVVLMGLGALRGNKR